MINLLVVDDESYTKEGIIEDYPWNELGINEIKGADDGFEALEIAASLNPDIIITDVRMPRMDGITLAYRLREQYPRCRIIFMSGYSDKEYLKSAIYLNAISYVEKPINSEELLLAVKKAVAQIREEEEKNRDSISLKEKIANSIPFIKNELALQLTKSNFNHEKVKEYIEMLQEDISEETHFFTILAEFSYLGEKHHDQSFVHASTLNVVNNVLEMTEAKALIGVKDADHIIIHLYDREEITSTRLKQIAQCLSEHFEVNIAQVKTNLSAGIPVIGYHNVHKSYNMSVLASQKFFFHDDLKIAFYNDCFKSEYTLDEELIRQYQLALTQKDRDGAIAVIRAITSEVRRHDKTLIKNVKNLYHRLVLILETFALKEQIQLQENLDFYGYMISNIKTLTTLEGFLLEKLNLYFERMMEQMHSQDALTKIQKYIQLNYSNPHLSLTQISEANYMSMVYLCSYFKEKTGMTVNSYITDIRMEKAKELLTDPNLKINDVARLVGYRDGNYFAKTFRKVTGLTPSEFREKAQPV